MTRTVPILVALIALMAIPASVFAAEPEKEVRTLVVAFNAAYLQNDLDKYFDYYADDATIWFNSGRSTVSSYREGWYKLIEAGGGVQKNALSDIEIQIGPSGDAAIVTYQVDVETRSGDGSVNNTHAHETDVWFRTSAGWRITHVHYTAERDEK